MATTATGVTYLSADKIAISLIENPPARTLTASEKNKIKAYMARPADERAAIEQEVLGRAIKGSTTTPPTPSPTPAPTPTPTTAPSTDTATGYPYATSPNPPPNPVDNWMKIPISPGVYYAGPGAGYPTADGSISGGGDWTAEQIRDYNDYVAWQKDNSNWPVPKGIDDYFANRDEWVTNVESYEKGYTEEQIREFNTWKRYASTFGGIEDWYPTNLEDWLANYDQAQQQLSQWQQLATTEEQEQLAVGEYALDPAEAARRREESYALTQYGRKEAYRETPRYQPTFAAWIGQQGDVSQALKGYIEREYPSLKAEYQAGLTPLTGFPTREAARAEAARRETGWQAWLGEKRPEVYQEYMSQPPLQRGERPYMYQKTLRAVNW